MGKWITTTGALRRGEDKRDRLAAMNEKLAKERAANAEALRQGGFVDRDPNRYNPSDDGRRDRQTPVQVQSAIPVVSPQQMQKATAAYRLFHAEKDFKRRQQYGADFGNALGFNLSTVRQAYDLIHSEDARRVFGVFGDNS